MPRCLSPAILFIAILVGSLAFLLPIHQGIPLAQAASSSILDVSVREDGSRFEEARIPGEAPISHDGTRVIFTAKLDGSGKTATYVKDMTNKKLVPIPAEMVTGASLSGDGKIAVYEYFPASQMKPNEVGCAGIELFDSTTGITTTLLEHRIFYDPFAIRRCNTGVPFISSDGNTVIYQGNDVSEGFARLYRYDVRIRQRTEIQIKGIDGSDQSHTVYLSGISADGRYIVFQSDSSNLVIDDTNNTNDAFRYDLQMGKAERANVSSDEKQDTKGASGYGMLISGNGRYVSFMTYESFDPADTNNQWDGYIRDMQSGTTIISGKRNGQLLSASSGLVPTSISYDGQHITVQTFDQLVDKDRNDKIDVYLKGVFDDSLELVSHAADRTSANGTAAESYVSGDGTRVLFSSDASNITPGDTNGAFDVFLYNRVSAHPVVPKLDLPVAYSNFPLAAKGNISGTGPGRVNSWFDHTSPDYSKNKNLTRWDGQVFDFNTTPSKIGESWYDGHNGIDFQSRSKDERVFAAAPGTVIKTVRNCVEGTRACGNYYGNQVWIRHDDGYATLYAHLKSVAISDGATITDIASQPLGIMGNTGNSQGTHLHFGVYYDLNGNQQWTDRVPNEAVDPYGWFGTGSDPWSVPSKYLWKYPLHRQQAVDAVGATITSPSGTGSVTVPSGAVAAPVTLQLWDAPPVAEASAQLRSTGRSFWLRVLEWLSTDQSIRSISAKTTSFSEPVTLSASYKDVEFRHIDKSQLAFYRWNESSNTWAAIPTTVDTNKYQVSAQTIEAGRFDLQAPLLCPLDEQEPNDNYYAAKPLSVDGSQVVHLFDVAEDEDWFQLDVVAGQEYVIQTENLTQGVGAYIEIYDIDGISRVASSNSNTVSQSSKLQWRAPLQGTYFIRVAQITGGAYGCTKTYGLRISGPKQQVYLPFIVTNEP